MITHSNNLLGMGLYTPAEAARYVKVRPRSLKRWLWGDQSRDGRPVVAPELPVRDGEHVVTFHDLAQTLSIRSLRTKRPERDSISLQKIRQVVQMATDEFDLSMPLARNHTLYAYADRLILRIDDNYIGLERGVDKHQLYHHVVIEPYLHEIKFHPETGLANQWRPLTSGEFAVVLDPQRRFGHPIIEPSGLLVDRIVDTVLAEGSLQAAAEAHEIDIEAVRLALKYSEDYLAGIAA